MFVGFDTSNYTTSVAVFDGEKIIQRKKLLTVRHGEKGLRQSEAVFQHTVNLPQLVSSLNLGEVKVNAVAVSNKPRNVEESYMPCFLVGECNAITVAEFSNAPVYKTSHQAGHILAALYSVDKMEFINSPFIAFHLSGGTTEALLVTPDKNEIIKAQVVSESLDLKAGQAIDRTGVMLGLDFPCGKEIDELSKQSDKKYNFKPSFKGINCSLSGVENKVKKMIENGENQYDVSKFVLHCVTLTIDKMLNLILEKYGNMPVIFSGGVSSNSYLRNYITERYNAYFAAPEFSCDNAAGVAVYGYLKSL